MQQAAASDAGGGRRARLTAYLRLIDERPQWFAGPDDGVRIATDQEEILSIEAAMSADYAARGMPAAWAEVGVRYEDPYLMVLVDAVTFPDGSPGVHHRVVRRTGEDSGVAVLPLHAGRILLIRHFRHPLRDWTWEAPRGAIEPGRQPHEAVVSELAEEIEAKVDQVRLLGAMYGATAFMGLRVLLYAAEVTSYGRPAVGEGVAEIRPVTVAEFEDMVRAGEIVDSFSLGAFLHARLAGLV